MSAPATAAPAAAWAPYFSECRYELLATWRQPAFTLPTLLFPAMFYLFFGVVFAGGGAASSAEVSAYLLATYGAFGVIGTALFGFGVGVAVARETGEMRLKRVAPVPPLATLTAKGLCAAVFSLVVITELFALAGGLAGVALPRGQWLGLAAVLLVGTLPFAAFGLAIGTHVSGKASATVVNLIYLPMSFLSGLWIPIEVMPSFLRDVAFALPPYHLAQLALGQLGRSAGQPAMLHVAALLITTVICLAIAVRGLRRTD
ncbi:MAG: ABC transporter permease [Acidobacteriota bacterium]